MIYNKVYKHAAGADAAVSVPFGKRLKGLDGLRGVAILAVIAEHTLRLSHPTTVFSKIWAAVQESSWSGVDLFFVLSGFLITGILLDSRSDKHYFVNFYARRTLRIFPLYYLVLATAILAVPALVGFSHLPEMYPRLIKNQVWLWTYMQNYLQASGRHTLPGFGHFWSLAVEEQFYWVWPLVVFLLPRRALFRLCISVCILLPVLRLGLMLAEVHNWAIRQYTFTRVDSLIYGAIAAIAVRDFALAHKYRRAASALVAAASCVLLGIGFRNGFLPYEGSETVVIGYSAFGILFSGIVYHVVTTAGGLSRFLSAATLRWFGKYSYAIYVFHWPVTQAYEAAIQKRLPFSSPYISALSCCLFVTLVSSAIAWLSWHMFEERVLRFKRYFEYGAAGSSRKQREPITQNVESPVLG